MPAIINFINSLNHNVYCFVYFSVTVRLVDLESQSGHNITGALKMSSSSLVAWCHSRTLAAWWTTLLQAARSLVSCSASSVDRCVLAVHSLMSSLQALRGLPLSRVTTRSRLTSHENLLPSYSFQWRNYW